MLYTPEKAAKMMNVNRTTVWRWIRQGKLKAIVKETTTGQKDRYLIDSEDLKIFKEEHDGYQRTELEKTVDKIKELMCEKVDLQLEKNTLTAELQAVDSRLEELTAMILELEKKL